MCRTYALAILKGLDYHSHNIVTIDFFYLDIDSCSHTNKNYTAVVSNWASSLFGDRKAEYLKGHRRLDDYLRNYGKTLFLLGNDE